MSDPYGSLPTRSNARGVSGPSPSSLAQTRHERIRTATTAGGLTAIPAEFGDPDGDWKTIHSESFFERLYLDPEHHAWISPESVRRNYEVLRRFWDEKIALLQQGAAETQIVQRYGGPDRNRNVILSYPARLREAAERLADPQRMAQYVEQLQFEKAARARPALENAMEMVFADGAVEPDEVRRFLRMAADAGMPPDGSARMFEEELTARNYTADGIPMGATLAERVVSVRWLAPDRVVKEPRHSAPPVQMESVCGRCGAAPEADAVFCQKCGNRLAIASQSASRVPMATPLPQPARETAQPVSVAAGSQAPLLHARATGDVASAIVPDAVTMAPSVAAADYTTAAPAARGGRSNGIAILVAVVVIAALIGGSVVYKSLLSFSSRIDDALAKGRLFSPPGECVADLYAAEKAKNPNSEALRDAAAKITARIKPMGDEAFRRWYSESEGVDWNETERMFAFLVELQPDQAPIKARHEYAMATLSLNKQHHAEALNHFNLALQADPSLVLAVNGIAKIYVQDSSPLKNDAMAIEYYQRAAAMDPAFTWAPKNLAEYYMRREEWRTAEFWMLKALATSSSRPSILRALARIYYNLQMYPHALDYNQRFLQVGRDPVEIGKANSAIEDIRRRIG